MSTAAARPKSRTRSRIGDLFFLGRVPAPVLAVMAIVLAVLATAAGYWLLRLQMHLSAQQDAGRSLNIVEQVIANGSSWLTVWPGWLAATCFLVAVIRLRRAGPEPPPGLASVERLSVKQLRSGLRAEYRTVRIALVILTLVATVDAGRAVAFGRGAILANTVARQSVVATLAEAAGLLAATVLLALWAWYFRQDLQRWGAIS